MMRFTSIEYGLSAVPGAERGTVTGAGFAVSPDGLAVSVIELPFLTEQASHGAGLAGQLTGPNRPSPLFVTVTVFVSGADVPRTARKSTTGCDSEISIAGAVLSLHETTVNTSGRSIVHHSWRSRSGLRIPGVLPLVVRRGRMYNASMGCEQRQHTRRVPDVGQPTGLGYREHLLGDAIDPLCSATYRLS